MGENKLRDGELFEALSNSEIEVALNLSIEHGILLIGKCDDESLVLIKPQRENSSLGQINGILKSSSRIKTPQNAIFSFVVDEKKYLFNSELIIYPNKTASIRPLSRIYTIQRRANDRLLIPEDFYALFKFTHINNRFTRSFGKVKDISQGGIAIVLRSDDPPIKAGDIIKGSLNLIGKPPEDLEFKIKHSRSALDGTTPLQIFGGAFHPEGTVLFIRRVTIIISDIYNDLFKSTKVDKK